jgi:hypothetical protein
MDVTISYEKVTIQSMMIKQRLSSNTTEAKFVSGNDEAAKVLFAKQLLEQYQIKISFM